MNNSNDRNTNQRQLRAMGV